MRFASSSIPECYWWAFQLHWWSRLGIVVWWSPHVWLASWRPWPSRWWRTSTKWPEWWTRTTKRCKSSHWECSVRAHTMHRAFVCCPMLRTCGKCIWWCAERSRPWDRFDSPGSCWRSATHLCRRSRKHRPKIYPRIKCLPAHWPNSRTRRRSSRTSSRCACAYSRRCNWPDVSIDSDARRPAMWKCLADLVKSGPLCHLPSSSKSSAAHRTCIPSRGGNRKLSLVCWRKWSHGHSPGRIGWTAPIGSSCETLSLGCRCRDRSAPLQCPPLCRADRAVWMCT